MKAHITEDFLRKLPTGNVAVFDTKLTGFGLRVRASGNHTYRFRVRSGPWVTLGRTDEVTLTKARLAAQAMLGQANTKAIEVQVKQGVTLTQARAKVDSDIRTTQTARVVTFGEFIKDTYTPWAEEHLSRPAEVLKSIAQCFSGFYDRPLDAITSFEIERWRSERRKVKVNGRPISLATINRNLVVLGSIFTRAVEARVLTTKPTIKKLAVDERPLVRFLSPAELARLLKALDARDTARRQAQARSNTWRRERHQPEVTPYGIYTDHLTPLVRLALDTGLRRGELFSLRWSDWQRTSGMLQVRGAEAKSGQSRAVALNADARKTLETWREVVGQVRPDDLIFPGDNGAELTTLKKAWERLMDRAQIKDFRFHDLRHTFASRLVMAGVDLNSVRELLGHADLTMTLRYAHLAPAHLTAAVDKIARRK